MTRALLDFPGPFADTLSRSQGSQVLLDFDRLTKNERLDIVPFVNYAEIAAWRQNPPTGRRYDKAGIERILKNIVRSNEGDCQATPELGPPDLSATWKCALRDAMFDVLD